MGNFVSSVQGGGVCVARVITSISRHVLLFYQQQQKESFLKKLLLLLSTKIMINQNLK